MKVLTATKAAALALKYGITVPEVRDLRKTYSEKKKCTKYEERVDRAGNLIEFKLDFDYFVEVWVSSGQHRNIGLRHGQYVMSRYQDLGHYEPGNVFIQLASENSREAKLGWNHSQETRDGMSAARSGVKRGWYQRPLKQQYHALPRYGRRFARRQMNSSL